ncbi:MAG: chain length determinant protein tyrosine kinase EpsG [Methylotenera sp.]|nr:chain length determinant protein tyrosine kinase EpsG [Methylotenera sp.]
MQNNMQVQSDTSVIMNPARESSIGKLLLQLGKITLADAENILLTQQKQGLRFGDAAIRLGLITEADIRQVLALQFDYPYLQAGQGNYSNKLVAAYQPFTQQVEALRALRSQLMMRWFSEGYKSIAIVSASAEEGSSYLAANLAIVFSQLGEKTLLVDANLRSPSQHSIFKLKENRGLSDILAGRASLDIATKVESFVDLSVLGAGTLPPNPQELLSRATFTDFMNQAITQYDVVLVDTTPAANTADAQATVARCGGALLVSKLNHTRIADLSAVRDQISLTGAQVVGAVINDF